jgi:glycosyltransferase 2 family protein
VRDSWGDAWPRLREADLGDLGLSLATLAAYYLLFVVGWQWILAAMGIRIGYGVALQAEMASMLAKYVPGTVWTPLARILWLRRVGGVTSTSVVLSSILLEAGLSAVAGVVVFVVGLAWVESVDAPLLPLVAFAVTVALLIHPRIFGALARVIFRRFGGAEPPPLGWATLLGLLVFYAGSWLVGGAALFFLLRAVGATPELETIPFLGGTAAVGAIVAVLSIIAPSGLGVREASMYGLLLAVTVEGAALGVTVLNRIAITLVEALLLLAGIVLWGRGRGSKASLETG